MATTGELRAIIEELQLVDIGDAASYLGEEVMVVEESFVSVHIASAVLPFTATDHLATSNGFFCDCAILP